jgi:hypothetical protein
VLGAGSRRGRGRLVDEAVQRRLGLTDHAIARFGERAGLGVGDRRALEPVLRDLLDQEGLLVAERPAWARSQNTADAYVQVGEWLLLICRHDVRRPGSWTVVTVVVGSGRPTWERAVARGLLGTPPPLPGPPPKRRRVGLAEAVRAAVASRAGLGLPWRIVAEYRDRRAAAGREHRERLAAYRALRADWEAQRAAARAEHRRRHG